MMMPKQKPIRPIAPMLPSCPAVKPNSPAQLSKIPPRTAKPTPAAKIAAKPAQRSRLALELIGALLMEALLIGVEAGVGRAPLAQEAGEAWNAGDVERRSDLRQG